MKTLLIPVDFTDSTEQLVHRAVSHFQQTPLTLVLVHAYNLPHRPTELVRSALTQCFDQDSLDRLEKLRTKILDRYRMFPAIRVETHSQFGSNSQVLEDCARNICPDFIVVAESPRDSRWAKLNPTLSARLVKRVEVPVLTLPLRSLRHPEDGFASSRHAMGL